MFLVINGEDYHDLPDSLTVAGLIAHLELPEKTVSYTHLTLPTTA